MTVVARVRASCRLQALIGTQGLSCDHHQKYNGSRASASARGEHLTHCHAMPRLVAAARHLTYPQQCSARMYGVCSIMIMVGESHNPCIQSTRIAASMPSSLCVRGAVGRGLGGEGMGFKACTMATTTP